MPCLGNDPVSVEGLAVSMPRVRYIFLIFLVLSFKTSILFAASKDNSKKILVGVYYLKNIFGHVHQNPSRLSASLTTISCNHPVKVYKKSEKEELDFEDGWVDAIVGPYEGFIEGRFLSAKQVQCFQDRYMKFFDSFSLELSELYHWGKLYDQYIDGKSKVR